MHQISFILIHKQCFFVIAKVFKQYWSSRKIIYKSLNNCFYKYINFDPFLFVESIVNISFLYSKELSGAMESSIDRAIGHA